MNLPFKREHKGIPTFFPHRILLGLLLAGQIKKDQYNQLIDDLLAHCDQCATDLDVKPKYHTLRDDLKDQWQVEKDIHFIIGNRSKNRYQFAPTGKVIRIDKVFMTFNQTLSVRVNDKDLNNSELTCLSANDGFDSVEDFAECFFPNERVEHFSGKIIHWTDHVSY